MLFDGFCSIIELGRDHVEGLTPRGQLQTGPLRMGQAFR